MSLVLVRHAEPVASADDDPRDWPLSPSGRLAAGGLRERLGTTGRWIASTECKAYQTLLCAAPADLTVIRDPRFDEVHRVEPFDDDFRSRRLAWVEGRLDGRHSGWESPRQAADRFELGVREQAAESDDLVIGSHGMVLTAWLVHVRHQLEASEAGCFWERMGFPDIIRVD